MGPFDIELPGAAGMSKMSRSSSADGHGHGDTPGEGGKGGSSSGNGNGGSNGGGVEGGGGGGGSEGSDASARGGDASVLASARASLSVLRSGLSSLVKSKAASAGGVLRTSSTAVSHAAQASAGVVTDRLDAASFRMRRFADACDAWADQNWVGRYFLFRDRKARLMIELRAGCVTFLMVAYILAVNPNILGSTGGACNPAEVCDPLNYALEGKACLGNTNDAGAVQCMDEIRKDLITATAASSAISTFIMGALANLPLALAPGLGINAYVAYQVVGQYGEGDLTYAQAMAAIFIEGWIFLALSVSGVRGGLVRYMPKSIALATSVGIGMLLAFTGLRNLNVVVFDRSTLVTLGGCTSSHRTYVYTFDEPLDVSADGFLENEGFTSSTVATALATVSGCRTAVLRSGITWLGISGGILTALLLQRGVKGAMILGIAFVTIISWIPGHAASYLGASSPVAGGEARLQVFRKVVDAPALGRMATDWDWTAFGNGSFWIALVTFLYIDLLDCTGTLLSMAHVLDSFIPGFLDATQEFPGQMWAFLADGVGIVVGSMMGTTPLTVFIESAAGIEDGGRTGLTAIVIAFLFFISLFFSPILASIPTYATGSAVIMVGAILIGHVNRIAWDDVGQAVPALLTIILMPMTYSVAYGVIAGCVSYFILHLPALAADTGRSFWNSYQIWKANRAGGDGSAAGGRGGGGRRPGQYVAGGARDRAARAAAGRKRRAARSGYYMRRKTFGDAPMSGDPWAHRGRHDPGLPLGPPGGPGAGLDLDDDAASFVTTDSRFPPPSSRGDPLGSRASFTGMAQSAGGGSGASHMPQGHADSLGGRRSSIPEHGMPGQGLGSGARHSSHGSGMHGGSGPSRPTSRTSSEFGDDAAVAARLAGMRAGADSIRKVVPRRTQSRAFLPPAGLAAAQVEADAATWGAKNGGRDRRAIGSSPDVESGLGGGPGGFQLFGSTSSGLGDGGGGGSGGFQLFGDAPPMLGGGAAAATTVPSGGSGFQLFGPIGAVGGSAGADSGPEGSPHAAGARARPRGLPSSASRVELFRLASEEDSDDSDGGSYDARASAEPEAHASFQLFSMPQLPLADEPAGGSSSRGRSAGASSAGRGGSADASSAGHDGSLSVTSGGPRPASYRGPPRPPSPRPPSPRPPSPRPGAATGGFRPLGGVPEALTGPQLTLVGSERGRASPPPAAASRPRSTTAGFYVPDTEGGASNLGDYELGDSDEGESGSDGEDAEPLARAGPPGGFQLFGGVHLGGGGAVAAGPRAGSSRPPSRPPSAAARRPASPAPGRATAASLVAPRSASASSAGDRPPSPGLGGRAAILRANSPGVSLERVNRSRSASPVLAGRGGYDAARSLRNLFALAGTEGEAGDAAALAPLSGRSSPAPGGGLFPASPRAASPPPALHPRGAAPRAARATSPRGPAPQPPFLMPSSPRAARGAAPFGNSFAEEGDFRAFDVREPPSMESYGTADMSSFVTPSSGRRGRLAGGLSHSGVISSQDGSFGTSSIAGPREFSLGASAPAHSPLAPPETRAAPPVASGGEAATLAAAVAAPAPPSGLAAGPFSIPPIAPGVPGPARPGPEAPGPAGTLSAAAGAPAPTGGGTPGGSQAGAVHRRAASSASTDSSAPFGGAANEPTAAFGDMTLPADPDLDARLDAEMEAAAASRARAGLAAAARLVPRAGAGAAAPDARVLSTRDRETPPSSPWDDPVEPGAAAEGGGGAQAALANPPPPALASLVPESATRSVRARPPSSTGGRPDALSVAARASAPAEPGAARAEPGTPTPASPRVEASRPSIADIRSRLAAVASEPSAPAPGPSPRIRLPRSLSRVSRSSASPLSGSVDGGVLEPGSRLGSSAGSEGGPGGSSASGSLRGGTAAAALLGLPSGSFATEPRRADSTGSPHGRLGSLGPPSLSRPSRTAGPLGSPPESPRLLPSRSASGGSPRVLLAAGAAATWGRPPSRGTPAAPRAGLSPDLPPAAPTQERPSEPSLPADARAQIPHAAAISAALGNAFAGSGRAGGVPPAGAAGQPASVGLAEFPLVLARRSPFAPPVQALARSSPYMSGPRATPEGTAGASLGSPPPPSEPGARQTEPPQPPAAPSPPPLMRRAGAARPRLGRGSLSVFPSSAGPGGLQAAAGADPDAQASGVPRSRSLQSFSALLGGLGGPDPTGEDGLPSPPTAAGPPPTSLGNPSRVPAPAPPSPRGGALTSASQAEDQGSGGSVTFARRLLPGRSVSLVPGSGPSRLRLARVSSSSARIGPGSSPAFAPATSPGAAPTWEFNLSTGSLASRSDGGSAPSTGRAADADTLPEVEEEGGPSGEEGTGR